jgi:hypothetical protein
MSREPIEIEASFGEFVRTFRQGGLLSDFVGAVPTGTLNADFYFPADNVIAELKSLETDTFGVEAMANRVMPAFKWLGYSMVDFANWAVRKTNMPDDVSRRVYAGSVRSIVECTKKASRQIADTRRLIGKPNALGLVLIANDASESGSPIEIMNAVLRGFGQSRDVALNAAVYFTPNVYHDVGEAVPMEIWVPIANNGGEVLQSFIDDLGKAWFDYGEVHGRPSAVRKVGSNMEILLRSKAIPKRRDHR